MQNEARKFYKKLNKDINKKNFKPRINLCRNRDGEILNEEYKYWRDGHFEEHLNVREKTETTEIELDMEDDKDILPTIEEVQVAVKILKNNKAPGTDAIPAELLKNGLEVFRRAYIN